MGRKPDTTGREIYSHSTDMPVPWLPDPMSHAGVYDYLPEPFIDAVRLVLTKSLWHSVTLTDTKGLTVEYRYITEEQAAEWAVEIEAAKTDSKVPHE